MEPPPTADPVTTPTITSDKADYPPGGAVILTGTDWQPGEQVHIRVNDDAGQTWRRDMDVYADGNGNIRDEFTLPNWFVATYAVTATGAVSGTATTTFTDGDIRVRAAANGTQVGVALPAGALKTFSNGTCATPSVASSTAFSTNSGGNGYGAPSPALATATGQSLSATAPSSVTITGTTYTFSEWVSDNGNATRVSVAGSTACFLTNANGQISLTVRYSSNVATTTTAANASATYGDASVTLQVSVSPNTVNVGTVTVTVKDGSTSIGSTTSGVVVAGSATASFALSGVGAGTYRIEAAYGGGTGFSASSNSAQSPAPTLTIAKGPTTTTVTCGAGPFGYTGDPVTPCSASVAGPGGANQSLPVSYSNNTEAGTATASASYAETADHLASSDSVSFTISKADADCTVDGYTGVYDGDPHGATGTCAGVDEEDLSAGLDLGDSFTDVPGGSASWSFEGGTNYNDQTGSVVIVISKANAHCTVTRYHVTYDGTSHTATGTCTGVGTDGALSGLDLSGTTHTNAGTYTDPWTFTDATGNYNDTSGTVTDEIAKADATCSISGYNVVLDGNPHTATGTCTGVDEEDLSSGLNLAGTTHTNVGDYPNDPWTFISPNANYENASGIVHDNIHYATAGSCLGSPGHEILQPIDNDGSSVFKQGSTVPAKFRVCDAAGNSIGVPGVVVSFRLIQTISGATTDVDEPVFSTTPDTAFRWSVTDRQWIFNINTKSLSRNRTYVYRILLNDGSAIDLRFGLR